MGSNEFIPCPDPWLRSKDLLRGWQDPGEEAGTLEGHRGIQSNPRAVWEPGFAEPFLNSSLCPPALPPSKPKKKVKSW